MLCLNRRAVEGQREIVLTTEAGEEIIVTVLSTSEGRCRLGITAPKTVNVRRSELPSSVLESIEGREWAKFVKGAS